LKKLGLKEESSKYKSKLTPELELSILALYKEGKTCTEMSKIVPLTPTGLRAFLKRKDLAPIVAEATDTSRPCHLCGNIFTPKYNDGPKKDKYKACSRECAISLSSIGRTKFSASKV